MNNCKFCGKVNENNPGDHYHYHECWRNDVLRRINLLKSKISYDPKELTRLEHELEIASYVGD